MATNQGAWRGSFPFPPHTPTLFPSYPEVVGSNPQPKLVPEKKWDTQKNKDTTESFEKKSSNQ